MTNKVTEVNLGAQPTAPNIRDAVHIAVISARASTHLRPGDHVLLDEYEGELCAYLTLNNDEYYHGIVDPWQREFTTSQHIVWILLNPNTITSLRHVWTHPGIPDEHEMKVEKPQTEETSIKEISVRESWEWIRQFCKDREYEVPSFATMKAAIDAEFDGSFSEYSGVHIVEDRLHFSGTDASGEIPPEFWKHVENITKKRFMDPPTYFSCSC